MELQNQNIILGVTGGISIHKSLDLASQLVKQNASVHVVMTENATRLVQPLQFQVISRHPVLLDLFSPSSDWKPVHIDLADNANLLAIVPATANIIGKLANGIADDPLSTVAIAVHCPILIAPAMNGHMYQNPFVQANLQKLREHNIIIVEPATGSLACGYEGVGRLSEIDVILERMAEVLTASKDFQGKNVVVTAGPTREYLDPVRFISNRSSGKMGYAIAEAAHRRGATVTLISGPASIAPPVGVDLRYVETAVQMRDAVLEVFDQTDILVMAAAVADYRPHELTPHKIKKTAHQLTLHLEKTPDILKTLGAQKRQHILVGFAAETEDLLNHAQKKLIDKNLDLIVANDVSAKGAGFEVDTNIVTLLDRGGNCEQLPLLSKREVANRILDRIAQINSRVA